MKIMEINDDLRVLNKLFLKKNKAMIRKAKYIKSISGSINKLKNNRTKISKKISFFIKNDLIDTLGKCILFIIFILKAITLYYIIYYK
jgi:hypothetical protein